MNTIANDQLMTGMKVLIILTSDPTQTQIKSSILFCLGSQDFGLPLGQSARSTRALVVLQFGFDQVCAGRCVCACANCEGHLEGCGGDGRAAT